MTTPLHHVQKSLAEAAEGLARLQQDSSSLLKITQAAALMVDAFRRSGRVFSCGNGGSLCDAMHFAEELTGRYRLDRPPLAAACISDVGHISCTSNDYGYEDVFSRYLEAHGRSGDVLLGISTSGKSLNIIKAAEMARQKNMKIVTLTGRPESALSRVADLDICTPAGRFAERVQELHIKVIHILIELIEREMFPGNYDPL